MQNKIETYKLTDENGIETEYELIDVVETDNERYYAFVPHEGDTEDLMILKRKIQDGEEMLVAIDDAEEFEKIGELFLKRWK